MRAGAQLAEPTEPRRPMAARGSRLPWAAGALGLVLGLAAPPTAIGGEDPRVVQPTPAAAPQSASARSSADHSFLGYAVEHARLSGDAHALARERAAQPALRRLAGNLLAEQRALAGSLLALAGDAVAGSADGPHPDLDVLIAAGRLDFDREFLRLLLVTQREAVSRYRTAAEDPALSAEVREFARDALPLVELHLELARDTDRMLAELE